jgi:hypothetical protein
MLGGGFGFGFGNFLQVVLSNNAGFSFNWWNVMEYSIGFFGGIGLAYGVFSSQWPKESEAPAKWENKWAFLMVIVIIPLIIFRENFTYNSIIKRFGEIDNAESVAMMSSIAAGITMLSVAVISWIRFSKTKADFERKDVAVQLALYLGAYIFISYIISQMFAGHFLFNHHLYIVNLAVVLVLAKKQYPSFFETIVTEINGKRWALYLFGLAVIFAILALIAINSHGEIGHHTRFPIS